MQIDNFSIEKIKFQTYWNLLGFHKSDMPCKENYKAVSILAALSKIFEKVHYEQMTSYFDDLSQRSRLFCFVFARNMVVSQPSYAWRKTGQQ